MNKNKVIPIIIPYYDGLFEILKDTIDSIKTYFHLPYKIIIVDDFSQDGTYEKLVDLEKRSDEIKVLRSLKNRGWGYGLWVSVGIGLDWALKNLDFDFAMRIDCDGLIIKSGLDHALSKLYANKKIGIAGHFQVQNNHFWFWHLRVARKWKKLAQKNGYFKRQDTENSFWFPQEGLMTFGVDLIKTISNHGHFNEKNDFYKKFLGSNGLFDGPFWAILCYANGFEAIDLPAIRSYFGAYWLFKIPPELFRDLGVSAIHPLKRNSDPLSPEVKARKLFNQLREFDKNRGAA